MKKIDEENYFENRVHIPAAIDCLFDLSPHFLICKRRQKRDVLLNDSQPLVQ
jgi:hypothetical protein